MIIRDAINTTLHRIPWMTFCAWRLPVAGCWLLVAGCARGVCAAPSGQDDAVTAVALCPIGGARRRGELPVCVVFCVLCAECVCDDVQSLRNTQVAEPRLCAPIELLYFLGEQSLMCLLRGCCRCSLDLWYALCGDADADKSILTPMRSCTALLPAVRTRR
ncbi:hypothetical protein ABB37_07634 [Leptomonas pyrrhocoris]|uniref:Uncharacterized protein n=1 Tax=Leptomonas pyrrhocoris TaxID=157538 RepID=A0A0N0DT07_LEPPY|nr:hypothetical protein ABB37_07620 [Leptomonas pyrrhocoris]XP_015655257.1 hypothetical protein ABB37_07622 [Leptomonas pyrrhocoris]XP_015655259.1 hypothetical protein ABB37_07624 [Leptomonas pyrrhocoris]XP_015655261.1 hypothetical protein ABB37_07626 [Leptomonas pyrrhocoris]XP_015655263.1 hypothetical protein ABB37_07628 [Leptomonas pyrrhocoris]XP_015655265.1 hypothetical protein ABB37_07630 [Leptomonas pyrrhocoris]XP_015655267.1 hypothetical protein ABB37_07632 [Leptomonas pyrrhocoris]XP_0|eukprot:XP_015655255.1 hypothetical protein ABB37_07620 [Leptomonas pyrrhocoris]